MPDVRVTAETWDDGEEGPEHWRAEGYGGWPGRRVAVVAPDEEGVHAAFRDAWNAEMGSDWAPDEFVFVYQAPPET